MSLGVLNNVNATYAANNLNNTSNSLSKVLQQLSSGSKINSGSDDAAGLSLVNGLQANQQALSQSTTNATEGVGLLQVADGALSQVTSLLNRAVTLATEVSNGTLNSAQQSSANTEYKSILSEISNIGSTTTYNQQTVFGNTFNIYTGDSTANGSSINSLNIRSLSSSNLGDTNGAMSYSTASSGSNVFIDLTVGTDSANKATTNDYLNGGSTGSTKLTLSTLSSTGSVLQNTLTVGGNSGYANTAQGMISAINDYSNSNNLGISASFTTDKIAGSGTTGDTGIQISGAVGSGSSPSTASYSGTIKGGGANAGTDTLTGSVTLQVGNNTSSTISMDQVAKATGVASGAVTMSNLKDYINSNASLGVSASINASTGVMTLSSTATSNPTLKVTSNLTDTSNASGNTALTYSSTAAYSVGISSPTAANGGIVDSTIGGATSTYTATTPAPAVKAAGTVGTITTNANGNLSGTLTISDTRGGAIVTNLVLGAAATGAGTGINSGTDTIAHLQATLTAYAALDTNANSTFAATNSTTLTIAQSADAGGTANVATTLSADATNVQTTADAPTLGATSTGGGIATISYSDSAGQSLSGTDLSSQADAQSALTKLNSAITDVAAQDGYIGAQINTLNSVSSVLSTQQTNIQSAQNAVQATDYATASSNMSKYEILSQTGISALAQANSVQQEVTKLLQ
ncbi:MAG: flagellin [Terracidiphilus sp.]|nr:flagellin [Terracidiphilus sp.]